MKFYMNNKSNHFRLLLLFLLFLYLLTILLNCFYLFLVDFFTFLLAVFLHLFYIIINWFSTSPVFKVFLLFFFFSLLLTFTFFVIIFTKTSISTLTSFRRTTYFLKLTSTCSFMLLKPMICRLWFSIHWSFHISIKRWSLSTYSITSPDMLTIMIYFIFKTMINC